MSGCVPDNTGLLLKLSLGAGYSRLWAAEVSTSGLGGSGEILRDDTSGSSALCGGEAGEATRSPPSPGEDPPRTNSVEKGYEPDFNKYVLVTILRDKVGYVYQSTLSLMARWRAGPLAGAAR